MARLRDPVAQRAGVADARGVMAVLSGLFRQALRLEIDFHTAPYGSPPA
jgi:hypothetical protein